MSFIFSCRKYCDKNMTCTNWQTRVHFNKNHLSLLLSWMNQFTGRHSALALCRVDVRKRPLSGASQVTLCAWWPLCSRSSWSTPRFCPLWCARWWRLRTRHRWSHQTLRPPDTEAAGGAVSRSEDVSLQVSSRLLERKAEGERGYFCLELTFKLFSKEEKRRALTTTWPRRLQSSLASRRKRCGAAWSRRRLKSNSC